MILRTYINNACSGQTSPGTIHVVGDSHAGAYARMLDGIARRTGQRVIIRELRGCGVVTLHQPIQACGEAATATLKTLAAEVKEGDTVFLPSLRLPRYFDQGADGIQDAEDQMRQWVKSSDVALWRARTDLAPLAARNVHIIFELPKPLFKAPAYRCADWFNARNEVCRGGFETGKAEIEALRAPVLAMAKQLAANMPQLTLWDPLPVLCPMTPCRAFRSDAPLFFDADHLSGVGNMLLVQSFERALTSRQH